LYQAIGKAVAEIHHGPPFPDGHPVVFLTIQHNLAELKGYSQYKGPAEEMERMLSLIHEPLSLGVQKVPCHNDLFPSNLIWSVSSFKIIDYEEATQDNPYFDLATVIITNSSQPWQEELLLKTYFGRALTSLERARLYLAKVEHFICGATRLFQKHPGLPQDWGTKAQPYADLVRSLWKGEVDLSDPTNQFRFGLAKLEEARKMVRSQQFCEAVDLLSK